MSPHIYKEHLLNSSGCLTLSALERFRDKGLSSEEMTEVEAHLSGCQMCRDALEGLTMLPSGSSARTGIREINARLRKRHRYLPAGMSNERKSPRLSQLIIPAAASIILLASIIGYFNYFLPEKQELAIAEKKDVFIPIPEDKELVAQPNTATIEKDKEDVIAEESTPEEKRDMGRIEELETESELVLGGVKTEENNQSGAGALTDDEFITIIIVEDDSTIESAINGVAEDEEVVTDEDLAMQEPSISVYDNEAILLEEVAANESVQKMSSSKVQAKRQMNEESQDTAFTFAIIEEMPEFPGGERALLKYIREHMIIPQDSNAHQADTAYFSFVVNKEGRILDVQVLKSAWEAFDQEAVRMIKSMPLWKPGEQRGKPVSVKYTLPIRYKPD